ncbi:MAG: pyrroline-5-carboxylate reductase [Candidatus Methanoplasma sp.]|jgi:pyrroline-5-carboxylate reductase|nr:pyrroline-5-carboxylate reductase [Candidatus Methanoplasma sp.]
MTVKIGFVGAGRMAEATIRGLIAKNVFSKDEIIACAPSETTRVRVSRDVGIKVYETAAEVVEKTNIIVLAVKPKQIQSLFVTEGLKLGAEHLLISIAAGITIDTLKTYVPDSRIVRVMPNHCCLVLEGAAGYARGNATDRDIETVKKVFSAIGLAAEVREEDMDAVTGVSGSSPAFMYMFLRAVIKAGVDNGLTEEAAKELAAQSMIGAGKMALASGKGPEELVDNVCSPGGTTIEGVKVLNEGGLEALVYKAVEASIRRSEEMSGKKRPL